MMITLSKLQFVFTIQILFAISTSSGFTVPSRSTTFKNHAKNLNFPRSKEFKTLNKVHQRFGTSLASSGGNIVISSPTPENAADMGIREWPQQTRSGTWQETVQENDTVIRYILEGTGILCIKTSDTVKKSSVGPGTLVEASGQCDLIWEVKGNQEMIVLTPTYEEGGKLAVVALGLITLCIASVVGFGS